MKEVSPIISILDIVSVTAFRAKPLPLWRHHDANALKMKPLKPTVGGIAANHLRDVVVGTLTNAVQFVASRGLVRFTVAVSDTSLVRVHHQVVI